MSNKRYKLLVQLPDCNKGAIAEWDESGNCYQVEKSAWVSPHRYAYFTRGQVEASPEFFTPIKEEAEKVDNERIEVVINEFGTDESFFVKGRGYYEFETSKEISEDKFHAIKAAIEFAINNKPEDVVIGGHTFKFQSVETEPEAVAPLFVTDDGVGIPQGYEGRLWRVFVTNTSFEMWKPYEMGMPRYINSKEEKYFSTEQAAQEYILMNKPCLSVNEVVDKWANDDYFPEVVKRIAQSKINQ